MEIFIQIIGAVAFLFFVSSVHQKQKKNILAFQLIANFLYGIQYVFLGVITAGMLNFITVIRCFSYYRYENSNKKIPFHVLLIYLSIIFFVSFSTINGWLSIIPMVINIIYAISTWQKNNKILKICFTICGFIWFFYNIKVGAYAAVIGNMFEVISGIISIYMIKKNKKEFC